MLAVATIGIAAVVRGSDVVGVIFHSDYAEVFVKPRFGGSTWVRVAA